MFTSLDEIVLGAEYKDVISNFKGVCITKKQCLTGCDRVSLESNDPQQKTEILDLDITCLEYIGPGISERFAKKPAAAVAGAPSVRSSR